MIRLDKLLCEMGAEAAAKSGSCSKKGRVTVDGRPVLSGETKVEEREARICLDGQPLLYAGTVYYLLHKPAGVVTAVRDARERTVLELMREAPGKDLFPVGRLDKDTEGLLLVTNDGGLAHRLFPPKSMWKRLSRAYGGAGDGGDVSPAGSRGGYRG